MSYTVTFAHLCRALAYWRGTRSDTDHRTKNDPVYVLAGAFSGRVKERAAAEILIPTGNESGMAAEVTVDVAVGAAIQSGDLVKDAGHPAGPRVWRVESVEFRGEPVPRAILKCSHLQKTPTEMR